MVHYFSPLLCYMPAVNGSVVAIVISISCRIAGSELYKFKTTAAAENRLEGSALNKLRIIFYFVLCIPWAV